MLITFEYPDYRKGKAPMRAGCDGINAFWAALPLPEKNRSFQGSLIELG
jgi:hypothetical protein